MFLPKIRYTAYRHNLSKTQYNKKSFFSFASLMTLSACGGGGTSGNNSAPTEIIPLGILEPKLLNFTESTTNVYIATGNGVNTFAFQGADVDLTVTGGDGTDYISTGKGNDIVRGGDGSDNIGASPGADILDGGGGTNDTLLVGFSAVGYDWSTTEGVNLNFTTGESSGGVVEGDQISNFENAWLTSHADVFIGSDIHNYVEIGGGNDVIDMRGGDDSVRMGPGANTVEGGDGSDTVGYDLSDAGIQINLTTHTASGGYAQGDILSGIENITGSKFDDTLTGDANDNYFRGEGGDDLLSGEAGNDSIQGGAGNDIIIGGSGNDSLEGGLGIDILNGGDGDDFFNIYDTNSAGGDGFQDSYDGGLGEDSITLNNFSDETFEVNLSNLDAINIEEIEIVGFGGQIDVTLTAQDILDITDLDNDLIISTQGSTGSVVLNGQGWVQGADQVIGAHNYEAYTSGSATLLVDDDIALTIS